MLNERGTIMLTSELTISSIKKTKKELYRLAYTDNLTGVYNSNMLEEFRKKLDTMELFVTIVDVDNLKVINDIRGHSQGDFVIAYVAEQLLNCSPWVFRLGGDEFLVLQESTNSSIFGVDIDGASYGTIYKLGGMSLSAAMKEADSFVYKHKQTKKKGRVL